MKRLVILFISLITVTTGSAQIIQFHAGATTAVNATYILDKGLSEDPRYNATATYEWAPIGFNFGVDLGRKFGISLEGIKAKQGQVYDMIDTFEEIKGQRKISLEYFQLPMLFRFMSGGNAGTRANFNIGPQLSFLTDATESITADAGQYEIPQGLDFASIQTEFPTAVDNGDGTYTLPGDVPSTDLLTKEANDFKDTQFSITGSFGLDIDLSKHLYLTTQVRATYSPEDMRNGDVIDAIKNGDAGSIFAQRANMLVGFQLGLHYMFGTTRSHRFKE